MQTLPAGAPAHAGGAAAVREVLIGTVLQVAAFAAVGAGYPAGIVPAAGGPPLDEPPLELDTPRCSNPSFQTSLRVSDPDPDDPDAPMSCCCPQPTDSHTLPRAYPAGNMPCRCSGSRCHWHIAAADPRCSHRCSSASMCSCHGSKTLEARRTRHRIGLPGRQCQRPAEYRRPTSSPTHDAPEELPPPSAELPP